jgi:hypothetical protein
MTARCPKCRDARWVCESHPDRPWGDVEGGCLHLRRGPERPVRNAMPVTAWSRQRYRPASSTTTASATDHEPEMKDPCTGSAQGLGNGTHMVLRMQSGNDPRAKSFRRSAPSKSK